MESFTDCSENLAKKIKRKPFYPSLWNSSRLKQILSSLVCLKINGFQLLYNENLSYQVPNGSFQDSAFTDSNRLRSDFCDQSELIKFYIYKSSQKKNRVILLQRQQETSFHQPKEFIEWRSLYIIIFIKTSRLHMKRINIFSKKVVVT